MKRFDGTYLFGQNEYLIKFLARNKALLPKPGLSVFELLQPFQRTSQKQKIITWIKQYHCQIKTFCRRQSDILGELWWFTVPETHIFFRCLGWRVREFSYIYVTCCQKKRHTLELLKWTWKAIIAINRFSDNVKFGIFLTEHEGSM